MRTDIQRASGTHVRFGVLSVRAIEAFDIEALKDALFPKRTIVVTNKKGHSYAAQRGGAAAVRGTLGRLKAFFTWAVRKHHVSQNPFKPGGESIWQRRRRPSRRLNRGALISRCSRRGCVVGARGLEPLTSCV
jgi:hypothetical protein